MSRTGGANELYGDGPVSFKSAAAIAQPAGTNVTLLVESTATNTVGVAGDASLKVQGVLLEFCTATGDIVDVANDGVFNLVASGALTAGMKLAAAAGGKVRAWVAGDTAPAIVAIALDDIADTAAGRCRLLIGG